MQFYIFNNTAGRKMIYGNMPMMIFILAAGYLFTVYLLLALAKRNGKKVTSKREPVSNQNTIKQAGVLGTEVTEAVNSQ